MATKNIMKFADLSFDQIRMAIQDELKSRYGNNEQTYCWVREVFPGYAVYEREGKLWRVDYTVSGTEITVAAESKEVVPEYVPADNAATSMAALADQWLEIFKAGSYGDKGDYSTEDVAQLAETYDAKKDEAPVVIGHPKLNAPAFGWVKEVKADGDLLLAKFGEVNPDFEAAVKAGSFKKRSIALFRGDDGKLRLRHVGYLGAMAPEVKGLADATFSGADFQVVEFNEEEVVDEKQQKKFFESLREFFGLKADEKVVLFTEAQVTDKVNAATKPLQDKITAFEADQTKAAENTKTFSERAKAAIQKLKDKKRWLPAFEKMGGEQVFAAVAAVPTEITFGEGDKATKKSALDALTEFVDGLGEIVPEGKVTDTSRTAPPAGKLVRFNAPASEHTVVDQESVEMAEAAAALAQEKNIPFGEALTQVRHARTAAGAASSAAV